jgi:hypothetical protein
MRLPKINDKEIAILIAMVEEVNGTYTSYTLASKLYPEAKVNTPAATAAFAETLDATKLLMARDLVNGKRLKGVDGLYFDKLRLTRRGQAEAFKQQEAIKSRQQMKAISEQLSGLLG